jgi:hypothetical protein
MANVRVTSNTPEVEEFIKHQRKIYKEFYHTFLPVEAVFDLNTDRQKWYYIPGYNEYEISDHWNVRSMKSGSGHAYGVLLLVTNGCCDIHSSNGVGKRMPISEMWRLAMEWLDQNPHQTEYPVSTGTPRKICRTKRAFIDYNAAYNREAKQKGVISTPVPIRKEQLGYASFSVAKDSSSLTALPTEDD